MKPVQRLMLHAAVVVVIEVVAVADLTAETNTSSINIDFTNCPFIGAVLFCDHPIQDVTIYIPYLPSNEHFL